VKLSAGPLHVDFPVASAARWSVLSNASHPYPHDLLDPDNSFRSGVCGHRRRLGALQRGIRSDALRRAFALVRFRYLLVGQEPWTSLTSSVRARDDRWAWTLHRDVSMAIHVEEEFDAYVRTLSKKSRHNRLREARLMNAAGGPSLKLTAVSEVSQVPAFLDAAGRVFENSWHAGHGATYIGASPKSEAHLSWLVDTINFGVGDWEYKRVLATETQQVSNVWLITPSLRNAVAWSGPWVYRKIRNRLEKGLRVAGVGDPIMKCLRRHMVR